MLDGTLLCEGFDMLNLGNTDPHVCMHEKSNCHLTHMLFCHETMQDDDVHVPLGPAHSTPSTLVLPAWLRAKAGTLTSADWARLCELGVAAGTPHEGETEREGAWEACEMPMLELSASDEGFVW